MPGPYAPPMADTVMCVTERCEGDDEARNDVSNL
jgi:hypothetical protein